MNNLTNVSIEERVVEELNNRGIEVTLTTVVKNGITLKGISIKPNKYGVSATLYLDDGAEEEEFSTLCDKMEERCQYYAEKSKDINPDFKNFFTDEKYILDHVYPALQRNIDAEGIVSEIVYGDLLMTYRVRINVDGNVGTILIKKEHLDMWDFSYEDLKASALYNLLDDVDYDLLENVLPLPMVSNEESDASGIPAMVVLTNKSKCLGASSILCDVKMDALSHLFFGGRDFYIIPSSIHEVLLIDSKSVTDTEYLNNMIHEVNATCLDPKEILSDHYYIWKRK